MGQFEKIVVLTVLSLIAVILVISFSTSEDPLTGIAGGEVAAAELQREPADPGGPAPKVIPGRRTSPPAAPGPYDYDLQDPFKESPSSAGASGTGSAQLVEPAPEPAPAPAEETPRERLLLNAPIQSTPAPAAAPAREAGLPEDSALLTTKGLEDTFDPELKLYAWRSGDSFEALARRFYGDAARAELLRLHNEGRESIPAGETILVPVFDHRGAAPERVAAGRTHLVQDGESLWSIAKKAYGRGTDWQRIFDANQDRLNSPDDVRAGMELRLP